MNKTHILIVNLNNLEYTKNCISDLLSQDTNFDLTIIDQNSYESGTKEYMFTLYNIWNKSNINGSLNLIYNTDNIDLNRVWDDFYKSTDNEYLCFLNNDIRLPNNFVSDGEKIFQLEENVGCVSHATNHPNYQTKLNKLEYSVVNGRIKQGWDFTFRRKVYNIIPNELKVYCGDDFLFEMLYKNKYKVAFALSSPIIHFQGMSSKFLKEPPSDVNRYAKLGFPHDLVHCVEYSRIKPSFTKIK